MPGSADVEDPVALLNPTPDTSGGPTVVGMSWTRFFDALGVPVAHQTDMNYNADQSIAVLVTEDGKHTPDFGAGGYRVTAMVSSKGAVWARAAWRKGAGREWLVSSPQAAAGLRQVPDEVLDNEAEGRVTEMDELPATVRDILFCEVC